MGCCRHASWIPANGYRYYAADQVRTGWLIALLRSADLSLDEIADIVGASADERPVLLERVVDAARQRAEVNLAVLARARHHLRGESTMTDLSTRVESDRAVLSVLRRMRPDEMDRGDQRRGRATAGDRRDPPG